MRFLLPRYVCCPLTTRDCCSEVFSPVALATMSSKARVLVLFTADIASPKVVTFSIWGAGKMKLLCCLDWLIVLVCKPCTSVLEEFSWKNSFSLLSYAYYLIFFLLESNYCVFTEAGLPVVLSHTVGGKQNGLFSLQSKTVTNFIILWCSIWERDRV